MKTARWFDPSHFRHSFCDNILSLMPGPARRATVFVFQHIEALERLRRAGATVDPIWMLQEQGDQRSIRQRVAIGAKRIRARQRGVPDGSRQ